MKTIIYFLCGLTVGLGFITTASANYYYPNTQSYQTYSHNSVYTVQPSYTYTSGCNLYWYNGTTRQSSVIGYTCSNNNNNTSYTNYTYPVTNSYTYTAPSTYYTAPSTYYTYPSNTTYPNTYYYQDSTAYPTTYTDTNTYYYYNTGYTDTGYNNSTYYNNYNYGYKYVDPNPCYQLSGFQVCY